MIEMKGSRDKYEAMNLKEAREALEKDIIIKALTQNNRNVTKRRPILI